MGECRDTNNETMWGNKDHYVSAPAKLRPVEVTEKNADPYVIEIRLTEEVKRAIVRMVSEEITRQLRGLR